MARTFDAGTTASSTASVIFESDDHFKRVRSASSSDGPPFKSVNFDVASASAVALLVNIPFLHGTSFYPVPVGTSKEFVCVSDAGPQAKGDIISVKGSGGTATYSGGITA